MKWAIHGSEDVYSGGAGDPVGVGKLRIRADTPTVTVPLSALNLCLPTRKDSVRVR